MMRVLLVTTILAGLTFGKVSYGQKAKELRRFQPQEVKQGVAVDESYFYVINNHSLTKHTKSDGMIRRGCSSI
jgi:hypothetical protein